MTCNQTTKPNMPRTKAEIKNECSKCKWASAKLRWCGRFGDWIIEHEKSELKKPSIITQSKHLIKDTGRVIKSRGKLRNKAEQKRCMQICKDCNYFIASKQACSKCGCKMPRKVKFDVMTCPLGKW